MTKNEDIITIAQIIEDSGLPQGATAVAWADTSTVETADQVADPSWLNTVRGLDYQGAAVGHLIYDEIPGGVVAWKFADPTEDARWLTVVDDIRSICHEDPSLVAFLAGQDDQ